jgi:GNAT superfamily N-acetyltransferase
MNLTITKADPAEADELTRVAHAAKEYWGYPHEWVALWKEGLTTTPDDIISGIYYVGKCRQEPVCFYSVRQMSANSYDLEDCWIAPPYIGRGFGRILFEHLKSTLESLGCAKLIIVSDPHAEGFYQKMGAVRVGEKPSVPEGRMLPLLEYEFEQQTTSLS